MALRRYLSFSARSKASIAPSSLNPNRLLTAFIDYSAVDTFSDVGLGETVATNSGRDWSGTLANCCGCRTAPPTTTEEGGPPEAWAGSDAWIRLTWSTNGGATGTPFFVPGAPWDSSPAGLAAPYSQVATAASDPVVVAAPNGDFHVIYMAFKRGDTNWMMVGRFRDLNIPDEPTRHGLTFLGYHGARIRKQRKLRHAARQTARDRRAEPDRARSATTCMCRTRSSTGIRAARSSRASCSSRDRSTAASPLRPTRSTRVRTRIRGRGWRRRRRPGVRVLARLRLEPDRVLLEAHRPRQLDEAAVDSRHDAVHGVRSGEHQSRRHERRRPPGIRNQHHARARTDFRPPPCRPTERFSSSFRSARMPRPARRSRGSRRKSARHADGLRPTAARRWSARKRARHRQRGPPNHRGRDISGRRARQQHRAIRS